MGTDPALPSLRPFIPPGVVMAATGYAHLKNEETQVFISLLTAFAVFVDDMYQRDDRVVRVFIDRFARGEKQAEPFLDSFALLLQEIPNHFEPIVSGIVLTAVLNLINASTLEFQTQGMEVCSPELYFPTINGDSLIIIGITTCRRLSILRPSNIWCIGSICVDGVSAAHTPTELYSSQYHE